LEQAVPAALVTAAALGMAGTAALAAPAKEKLRRRNRATLLRETRAKAQPPQGGARKSAS